VKQETQREASPGADDRDAMTYRCGGPAALGPHGPVTGSEDKSLTAREDRDRPTRLRSRTLLHEEEFATGVVDARDVEVDHDL
jgi:hypothetical protein